MIKYTMQELLNRYENNPNNMENLDSQVQRIVQGFNKIRSGPEYSSSEKINREINKKSLEFKKEFRRSGGILTVDIALKMADIVYCSSQYNSPYNTKMQCTECEEILKIDHILAQEFFIVAYQDKINKPGILNGNNLL